MDNDYLKYCVKNVDTQLFEIVSNLICSICQELLNKPLTTPCGHSFCSGCIKRVLYSKDNTGCPLCKNPVKRYALVEDAVKSTLIKISREVPAAFEKDVGDLIKSQTDLKELITVSNLFSLFNQEFGKDLSTSKQKSTSKRKMKKTDESKRTELDSESFVPVVKRTKNVIEYVSAKKKKMDELVSISQTEPASSSSLGDSSELDKKLKTIEKIPPEKKVNEWFNAVGDNIYINSPGSSILEVDRNLSEGEKKEEKQSTMIRRDYNKSKVFFEKENEIRPVDPYEFVPSQKNNNIVKKKAPKRSTGKKIPDFKTLESFSKENVKRNTILLDESQEDIVVEESKDVSTQKGITASQKFDQLLSETKVDEKQPHALFSSQSSSAQFLDVSFQSKVEEKPKKKRTPKVPKKQISAEDILFKNVEMLTEGKEKGSFGSKRRRSTSTPKSGKNKKFYTEITDMKNNETQQSPEERHLIKRSKKTEPPSTKLKQLLTELLDDDIIYATRPANAPVRLPDLVSGVVNTNMKSLQAGDTVTQNTDLIGFCTQEETPHEKNFRKMVKNMERELNSSEQLIKELQEKNSNDYRVNEEKSVEEDPNFETMICEKEQNNCELEEEKSEVPKVQFVEFLHLGKLTPIRKRAKSTVVKLVFPIGLTSLARRHALESRCLPTVPVTRAPTSRVSTGIQTSHETVSSLVQTSQVPQNSFNAQTSQEEKPSVEIQTTQKWTKSAEIQTSQRLVCQEIQTSQVMFESAQVQTTQLPFSVNSNLELPQTPTRKPSHKHRKIIQRKDSKEALDSPLELFPPEEDSLPEKDVIMDFGIEKEFDETWRNSQKYEDVVKMKNKKNKENDKKLTNQRNPVDSDSDDSEIQPPKRKNTLRIFSQDSTGTLKEPETRQLIPLNVKNVKTDEEVELIDLDTPGSQNSEDQMMRVLKNIDLDLPKGRNGNVIRGEKSEESDSDFFVEQTPPRPTSRIVEDIKNLSRSRIGFNFGQKQTEITTTENEKKENPENSDLIGDSLPKGFTESFLLLSSAPKVPLTPEKNPKEENQKKSQKIEPEALVDLPDENDQNQLNASEGKPKTPQVKGVVDTWKQAEPPSIIKTTPIKKFCIVASSVKNPDLIKKFASKFKFEYLNKPTKDMTHLIVGLHENEDNEILPLCTPKFLFAMANKKWVVSELWAEVCLKMNTVVPEESFETPDPSGGCGCRKARLSSEKILKNCEIYLLGEFQMISKEEFADLISDSGGILVPTPENFSFLPSKLRMIIADRDCLKLNEKQIQDLYQKHSTVILSRDLIIMSIQTFKLVNFQPYFLHPVSEENLIQLGYPLHLVKKEDEEDDEEGNSNAVVGR